MERITRGGATLTPVELNGQLTLRVRAPRMHVRWRTLDEPGAMAFDETAPSRAPEWQAAIEQQGLEEIGVVRAEALETEVADEPVLGLPGSPDTYMDVRATPREPDDGLLLMVETDGVVQWYLPRNPAEQEMTRMALFDAPPAPIEFRFHVPQSVLAPSPQSMAFDGGLRGAVMRFFKFRLVRELIGASVRRIAGWIIDNIEARNKTEAFRRFDKAAEFPVLTPADSSAMSGQRVLLLTHGIFSSLEGAFAKIADPAHPVRRHLGAVYGERIFGWDHWTVGKTPLENAADLLAGLPPGMKLDIVCHSRGALVTRAMLEHPSLEDARRAKFDAVGKAVFVAGANQGSQLATRSNLNRLLNIYAAVASIEALGVVGVALKVVVGLLKVLVHIATEVPSIAALQADETKNEFLKELNAELMTPIGEIIVAHANYDPTKGPLAKFLDLNVDAIFREANDMVVPFRTAKVFDKWYPSGLTIEPVGSSETQTQGDVMHLNFFGDSRVHAILTSELT